MPFTAKELLANSVSSASEWQEGYNPPIPSQNAAYTAPGRLGNPTLELGEDPRLNAQLLPLIQAFGLSKHPFPPAFAKLSADSTVDEIAPLIAGFEDGIEQLYNNTPLDLPEDKDDIKVERTEETIKGGDGQDMVVYVYRPEGQRDVLPGVVYLHGGGMVIGSTMNPVHDRWCRSIAAQNCVAVMPDFRNAYTKSGFHHFPAGLNDCVAGVKWVIANKEKLRVGNVVVEGESGGGNLTLATALKANRDGWVKGIAGVYAIVPYISNAWGWPEEKLLKELPSAIECNGFFLDRQVNTFLAHFYTPEDKDQANPLAWPYYATEEDMKGLPPHILVMDELDGLKDEGISYFRRLVKAGVEARGSVNLGVTHGSSLIFRQNLRQYNKGAVRDLAAFVREL